MSRIGKLPVEIPSGVKVDLNGQKIVVTGSLGKLERSIISDVSVELKDNKVWLKPANDSNRARAMWGMSRSVVNNMVTGVSKGYTVRLEITGVGFRAAVDGKGMLTLFLGYSHEIKYALPEGVKIVAEKPTTLLISGFDKELVGQVAAEIRSFREPEPYKGKGVKYEDETILMKEGKKK